MASPLDDLITDSDLGEARRPYAAVVRKTLGRDRRGNAILEDRSDMRLRRQGFSEDEVELANMPVAQRAGLELSQRRVDLDERQFQMQVRRQEFEEMSKAYEAGVKEIDLRNANEQRAAQLEVLQALGGIDKRSPDALEQIESLKQLRPEAFVGEEGAKLDARISSDRELAGHYRKQYEDLTSVPGVDVRQAMDDSGRIDYFKLRRLAADARQTDAEKKRMIAAGMARLEGMSPAGITVNDAGESTVRFEAPKEPEPPTIKPASEQVKDINDELAAYGENLNIATVMEASRGKPIETAPDGRDVIIKKKDIDGQDVEVGRIPVDAFRRLFKTTEKKKPAPTPVKERTIVNPNTGDRLVLRDGKWQPL